MLPGRRARWALFPSLLLLSLSLSVVALALLVWPLRAYASGTVYYVSTSGSPAGSGSKASPYDLASGIGHMAAGDTLRIQQGAYNWNESANGALTLKNSTLVEGGFDTSWGKDLSSPTSITFTPVLHTAGSFAYYSGLEQSSSTGFHVKDLGFAMPSAGAVTYGGYGVSVYAAHLNNCSNYLFERVSFTSGSASGGTNGQNGATGLNGFSGSSGGPGGASCGPGGSGGMGGGGTPGPGAVHTCSQSGSAGSGASGALGASGGSGGAGSSSTIAGGYGGYGGFGGGIGGPPQQAPPGPGGSSDCFAPANGGVGTNGSGGIPGVNAPSGRPTIAPAQRGLYFAPGAAAAPGADGHGGGGGAGGGGGGSSVDIVGCLNQSGPGGGGGGGGGLGGGAGLGGLGGGSSYAVYLFSNGANGEFRCCTLIAGAFGTGGNGGSGGAGGSGGGGGFAAPPGPPSTGLSGGGNGGSGGAGGAGGRGQDGMNGESVALETASGTSPTVSGGTDTDGDGWPDICDNCPGIANQNQRDGNLNGVGDVCDPTQCPNPGLVASWPAEGNANDVSGNSHDGVLHNGATFAPGKVGTAFSLDGVDDNVSVADSPAFSFSNAMSVAGWINTAAGIDRYIATKHDDSFYFAVGGGSVAPHMLSFWLNGPSTSWFTGSTPVDDGQWHHVAATYDGATMSVYVDGNLDGSAPRTGSIQAGTSTVLIGARYDGTNAGNFPGMIDELAIYDRALSAVEIQALAAMSQPCAAASVGDVPGAVRALELAPPWPNPASRIMNFEFRTPGEAAVRAEIVDVAGRQVSRPLRDQILAGGTHRFQWDGLDASGVRAAPGVYLIRVTCGTASAIQRIVLVR